MQKKNENVENDKVMQEELKEKENVEVQAVEGEEKQQTNANKTDEKLLVRRPLAAAHRWGLALLGILLLIAAGALFYFGNQPKTEEVESILYTYEYKSNVEYSVKMLPNTIFKEEWQPENNVYPIKLTDLIWVKFDTALNASKDVRLSGEYSVEAVLNAFQMTEQGNSNIYEKRYRLAEGMIEGTKEVAISQSVEVKPSDFAALVAQIEEEMGGATDKEFYVILSGTVYIEDEQNPQEKKIEQKVNLPIRSTDVYYSIVKPEAINDFEKVTSTSTITIKNNEIMIYGAAAASTLGVLLLIVVLLLTRNPNTKELRKMVLRRILKKNEERIVAVSQLPSLSYLTVLEVSEFETLLNHSEDIRELIMVKHDDDNVPYDNKFYLFEKDRVFVYEEKFEEK